MKRLYTTGVVALLVLAITSFSTLNSSTEKPEKKLKAQSATTIVPDLSTDDKASLQYMREEEKLARDVYVFLGAKWESKVFKNIPKSEQRHMDAVLRLLNKYNIDDPVGNNGYGKFSNPKFTDLYQKLTLAGSVSALEAYKIGATIEDLDIYDLQKEIAKTDKDDIKMVYENLMRASRNHMRAFYRNIVREGGDYTPQYISKEAFENIINGEMEPGGRM